MTLKTGVRLTGIKPEILLGMFIVDGVYQSLDIPCEILSIIDGNHDGGEFQTSSHYAGMSFDVAIPAEMPVLFTTLTNSLGDQFFVSVNAAGTQAHISFMPKQP